MELVKFIKSALSKYRQSVASFRCVSVLNVENVTIIQLIFCVFERINRKYVGFKSDFKPEVTDFFKFQGTLNIFNTVLNILSNIR